MRNAQILATVEEIDANVSSGPSSDDAGNAAALPQRTGRYDQAIRHLRGDIESEKSHMSKELISIIDKFLKGDDITSDLTERLKAAFPVKTKRKKRVISGEEPLRRLRGSRRKKEYAIMQTKFNRNMCLAAHEILDGKIESKMPSMQTMFEYWAPVFTKDSVVMNRHDNINVRGVLRKTSQ